MLYRQLCFLTTSLTLLSGSLSGQEADNVFNRERVPDKIFSEATAAVEKLGQETLKGNTSFIHKSMYPRLREREVKRLGGEAELIKRLDSIENEMARMGVDLIGFRADQAYSGFDVPEYNEWVVFVPTTRTVRGIDADTGKVLKYAISDYQVAVRGKEDGAKWTFINGSTLKIQELRSLFPSLPKDREALGLPEMGSKEVR